MTRFGQRRLVLVLALLCQVATAVHTPMAYPRASASTPHALSHCTDHAASLSQVSDQSTASSGNGTHSGHPCSCGLCQCPCAQAPALASTVAWSTAIPHLPVTLPYRAPDAPPIATVFFRPPI